MSNSLHKKLNVFLIICAMACLVFYDYAGGLWLKGVTSAWFVLLGGINLYFARKVEKKHLPFFVLMFIGFVFGMCADVLLGIVFLVGVAVFALGHIMFLAAFYSLEKFRLKDFFIMLPIAAFSIFLVVGSPWIAVDDPFMEKMLIGYALIISAMLAKAISNYTVLPCTYRKLLVIGSILFMFSDLVLLFDLFAQPTRLTWILCSYSYWPAQSILAHSLYHAKHHYCK